MKTFPLPSDWTDPEVTGINDSATVVGTATSPHGTIAGTYKFSTPFALSSDGVRIHLASSTGSDMGRATDVNNGGSIVGAHTVTPGVPDLRPVRWDSSGRPQLLPVPPETFLGEATAINERGDIVGWVDSPTGRRAVLWPAGTTEVRVLPNLASNHSAAEDINDQGVIVGSVRTNEGPPRAAVWTSSTSEPSTPHASQRSGAIAINDAGVVVGWLDRDGTRHAFKWNTDRHVDLGGVSPIPSPTPANPNDDNRTGVRAINDRGDMVGTAVANGKTQAVRFTE